ncbi:hypothetical protein HMPREF9412_6364 [Paenibacillus sp. HGF5]|nr:hypothetical protein HMPREF9412_6364 [Paenibacillus sp. HGF5]
MYLGLIVNHGVTPDEIALFFFSNRFFPGRADFIVSYFWSTWIARGL